MTVQDPVFSIIIPTRNRPQEFQTALNSVLAQTYPYIEIIVVNDGSKKEHKTAYKAIKDRSPNHVHFIDLIERERGHGHCFARNQGVNKATGNYIGFLDDDDWYLDNTFLERAAKEIKHHQADFYFANQKAVTHTGEHIPNVWVENLPNTFSAEDKRRQQTVFKVTIKELLRATSFPHMNCWLLSTQLYRQIGGMDENLRYEPDRDIYLRTLDKAKTILYDQTTVALHNVPEKNKKNNASTQTNILEKLLFQLRTIDKGILFSNHPELIQFCIKRKGYILKKITDQLIGDKKYSKAYTYAKQGLATSFTLKWLIFTAYVFLRKITPK